MTDSLWLRTLGPVSWRRVLLTAWVMAAVACLLAAWWFDNWFPSLSAERPLAANVVAGLALIPAEFFAGYVVINAVVRRNRERRWATVAEELTEAIGEKWNNLRGLLIGLFWVDQTEEVLDRIAAAERMWRELEDQERALAERVNAGLPVEWEVPDDLDEILGGVAEVWFTMWAAGSPQDRQAWHRRLIAVLLPRLGVDDPQLTAAARRLVDTLSDFDDLLASLSDHNAFIEDEPWPWEMTDDEVVPLVVGLAEGQLADLAALRQLVDLAGESVRRGDHLMRLMQQQRG
ncbi:hypothetical protein Q3V37_17715 [Micromonospora profundi]|uniref:Uncharacterized protein n=1 Tax=Micromonospora profundi TaxID=1420889 RepID=A0AAJ6HNH1_9ACTN|nr:hypothetical protein [Micromonospora profundi]WLS43257.1 hypothetical protein Q3V37_17715 [Micromonospora profundi]